MASAFKRDGKYVAKYIDAAGVMRQVRTEFVTKAAALQLARDKEEQERRIRDGLSPATSGAVMLFGALLDLWKKEYTPGLRSKTVVGFAEKHLRKPLGHLPLGQVSPDVLEGLLNAKRKELKPKSLNHLRALVHHLFELAIRRGRWAGLNPVKAVPRFKVPKRLPSYLRHDEAEAVMRQVSEDLRPLFAVAFYTGMRKGEILGLQRDDVDLEAGTIAVRRSYDHETTKGGHADVIPMAEGLRPFLVAALARSQSHWLFPHPSGRCYREGEFDLLGILRAALGRAGIVSEYVHKCRATNCRQELKAPDKEPRRCEKCNRRMWVTAIPKKVRFHDTRHTTATLLLKSREPVAVVSKLLRHSSIDLTLKRYGHLDVDDQRRTVNALVLDAPLPPEVVAAQKALSAPRRKASGTDGIARGGAPEVRTVESGALQTDNSPGEPKSSPGLSPVGETGFEPATPWSRTDTARSSRLAPARTGSQAAATTQPGGAEVVDGVVLPPPRGRSRGAPEVRSLQVAPSLLTVREVAAQLAVCTATVYKLCKIGELPHTRVLNAIRVTPAGLQAFVERHKPDDSQGAQ